MIRLIGRYLMLAVLASGCGTVTSIRPLYRDSDLEELPVDPRIEGDWISPDLDSPAVGSAPRFRLRVTREPSSTGNSYSIELGGFDSKDDEILVFDGRLVPIAGKLFLDAEFRESSKKGAPASGRSGSLLVPAHLIGQIWMQQDFVRIALLCPPWVAEHTPESFSIRYPERFEDDVLITVGTDELRNFVTQHADDREAFAYPFYLCRAGDDCALHAAEEELRLSHHDEDAVRYALRVFATRGVYGPMIGLLREKLESTPDDTIGHIDLGEVYMLNRDFAEARRQFAAVGRADLTPLYRSNGSATTVSARGLEDTAWSYFLEGRYADVVETLAAYSPPTVDASADPILLDYFSRIRLGRREEAESRLKASADIFKGSLAEHRLLLTAERRLADPFSAYIDVTDLVQQRTSFFGGLGAIASGHLDGARQVLQVVAGVRETVVGLAARIELERLGREAQK